MVLKKKLARATPQYNSKSHALQVLNVQECGVLANLGLQLLQNELPCAHWCAQNGDSLFFWPTLGITSLHSLASGSTRSAAACRASILVGASPLTLKAHVLPGFRRILACCHNSSAEMLWHSTVRSGGDTAYTSSRQAINRSRSLTRPDASERALC